jgi:hypothetical protein
MSVEIARQARTVWAPETLLVGWACAASTTAAAADLIVAAQGIVTPETIQRWYRAHTYGESSPASRFSVVDRLQLTTGLQAGDFQRRG